MKETRFIAQNKEKWIESENLLTNPVKNPEKLSNLFTQIVDDLSYSRTYYKNRSVRVYLNKIAREYFSIIYSHRKEKKNRFKLFWLDELPQIILYCRKEMLISLMVFLLAAAVGVFSAMNDPHFTSSILGESYVAMTKENIEKGDPMAVYKRGHQVDMFLGITLNNLMVAFRTYVFGIFMSLGTLAILLYNGIMVGCFQFFFIERGLFAESALTIWLHGTLEISSIIIAGGAGLTLGSGLLFPGTYSRLQAFQISAMRSLKLMLGISPIFVLAGLIESFLTRYTDVPDFVRLLLILLSAVFIIGYFVVYPWMKSKSGFAMPLVEVKLQPSPIEKVAVDRIKNNADILKDAFLSYKRHANRLLPWIVAVSAALAGARFFFEPTDTRLDVFTSWYVPLLESMFYGLTTPAPVFIAINGAGIGLLVYRMMALADAEAKGLPAIVPSLPSLIQSGLVCAAAFALVYLGGWGVLLLLVSFILLLLVAYTALTEDRNIFAAIGPTWKLATAYFGQVMGLQVILALMLFSFMLILSAPILYMYTEILSWNFAETDVWARGVLHFIEMFIKILALNLVLPIVVLSVVYLYFSLYEVLHARHLKDAIASIGSRATKQPRR